MKNEAITRGRVVGGGGGGEEFSPEHTEFEIHGVLSQQKPDTQGRDLGLDAEI